MENFIMLRYLNKLFPKLITSRYVLIVFKNKIQKTTETKQYELF